MSRSYVCRCEPQINPTTFWFCRNREEAWRFEGTATVNFFCDHLNKGTRVERVTLETFHIEPYGDNQFLIYSDTPFEDLERRGLPAHFDFLGSTGWCTAHIIHRIHQYVASSSRFKMPPELFLIVALLSLRPTEWAHNLK